MSALEADILFLWSDGGLLLACFGVDGDFFWLREWCERDGDFEDAIVEVRFDRIGIGAFW